MAPVALKAMTCELEVHQEQTMNARGKLTSLDILQIRSCKYILAFFVDYRAPIVVHFSDRLRSLKFHLQMARRLPELAHRSDADTRRAGRDDAPGG